MIEKEVKAVKLSIYPSKYQARWKSIQKIASAITIYIHHCKDKSVDYICAFILKYFLVEYLCSCIFRGNRFKKECVNRNFKKPPKIGCIPLRITQITLRKLWDLPLFPVLNLFPKKQLKLEQFKS